MTPPGRSLRQVGETIVPPLLRLHGGNDLLYLNHIIIAHYNASYGYGKCLKQAFVSSSALDNHKKVCIGLIPKKSTRGPGSKPISSRGGNGSCGGSTKVTPKDSKAPAGDSQGSSAPPASQTPPHPVDERCPATTSPTRTRRTPQAKRRKRRRRMRALPGRAPATRRPQHRCSANVLFSCILSIKDFIAKLMCLL